MYLFLKLMGAYLALGFLSTSRADLRPSLVPDLDEFCKNNATLCLSQLLDLRCAELLYTRPRQYNACSKLSFLGAKTMEPTQFTYSRKAENGAVREISDKIIFVKELRTLIQDPNTQTFLSDLHAALLSSIRESLKPGYKAPKEKLNLWSYALVNAKNDFQVALKRIGVLLQDTRKTRLAYEYLNAEFPAKAKPGKPATDYKVRNAIFDLEKITAFLDPVILRQEKSKKNGLPFDLFPAELEIEDAIQPKVYHFYPIAYLALKLKESNKKMRYPVHQPLFIPILFRAEAELRSVPPYDVSSFFLLSSVELSPENPSHRMLAQETYSAVHAAYFGFGLNEKYPVNEKDFSEKYLLNPKQRLKELYDELPRNKMLR